MAAPNYVAQSILERLMRGQDLQQLLELGAPRSPHVHPLPPRLPALHDYSPEALARRRDVLQRQSICLDALTRSSDLTAQDVAGNVENFVGFAQIPVGVAGPLRINGANSHGDFYVPLATSEGALVASYTRGAHLISRAGGATAVCLTESVSRAPCFMFHNLLESGQFIAEVLSLYERFGDVVSETSKHCKLVDMKTVISGPEVYLIFEFTTGDAAGQNMVTIATQRICEFLLGEITTQPRRWYIEGNMSGDKKATTSSFLYARGKKVVADVTVPRKLVRRYLHTDPESMFDCWQISFMGGTQSGSIGSQGHFANGLAALFIACGQDVACVSEAAVGMTRLALNEKGDLYAAVSLPNLIVGTVGGGTRLPTARECLEMLDCYGDGRAEKFAEICAATVLAGEVSIIGSLAAGDFTQAHTKYGRRT
jgi:hydroxymethylglutaryl-CoA reductase (NADPH)